MGLRFTDAQQPNYPPVGSFRASAPFPVERDRAWLQPLPRYTYEVDVEYHPRARRARAPRQVETWRIGLVQNVLYEHLLVEFADEEPFTVTHRRPALDIGSEDYRPFYNAPDTVEVPIRFSVGGIDREVVDRVQIVAVHELLYGPQGLGRLLDPFSSAGYRPMPQQVIRLRMEDQPVLPIRDHLGGELVRVDQVLVLRFWVVAQGQNSRPQVLGLSPPFTLVAWMRLARRTLRSIPPPPSWGSYSLVGRHTRILRDRDRVRRMQERSPPLRPRPGASPAPLLSGPSAISRTRDWMRSNRLLPPLREPERP